MRHCLWILVIVFVATFVGCPLASTTIEHASTTEHGNVSFDVAPDGESIVFSDAKGDLWLFALGNPKLTRLTETEERESWPSFSPDGNSVVYAKENNEGHGMSVELMTIDRREIRQVTNSDECSDSQPVYSSDGTTIAFARAHLRRPYSMGGWKWDNWDVYTVDLDGSDPKRRTSDNHYDISGVAFSANSQSIYFTADESRNSESKVTLFTLKLDDSTVVASEPNADGDYYAWYSDVYINKNSEMVFISDRNAPFHYDVVFRARDGQEKCLGVTSVSRYNQNPVLTNDGRILFLAGTEWNSHSRPIYTLWSVKTDGTSAKQLADSVLFTDPLEWARQQNAAEKSD